MRLVPTVTRHQLPFRAADFAVFPYAQVLTSGSLLLALSFGLPPVVPAVGMTREVLEGTDAGMLYDPSEGTDALQTTIRNMLARKDAGGLAPMREAARALAETLDWPDFTPVLVP